MESRMSKYQSQDGTVPDIYQKLLADYFDNNQLPESLEKKKQHLRMIVSCLAYYYYHLNENLVSDQQYDKVFRELVRIEGDQRPRSFRSITDLVGSAVGQDYKKYVIERKVTL